MPLPNAKPDPAGSNVYRQLNSIKLGDLTNNQFDVVYDNVFLNDMSEDEEIAGSLQIDLGEEVSADGKAACAVCSAPLARSQALSRLTCCCIRGCSSG